MFHKVVLAVSLAAALVSGPVLAQETREFRLGPASPPPHPAYSHLYVPFAKYLPEESGGRLTGKIYGMDVAGLKEMKNALQARIIEIGIILPTYFPANFPEIALTGELALLGRNPHAMAAATIEYIATCEPCQAEMKAYGGVFLASGSSDVYRLITKKPVKTLADIKGLKLRSSTATFSRLAEAMGAVPVSIASNDTFEAMTQGALDGSMASVADLVTQRLVDVAKYVTNVKFGTFHTTSGFTVNSGIWAGLSLEDRKAILRAATRANVDFTQRWGYDLATSSMQAGKKAGITFLEPDPELTTFIDIFAAKDLDTAAAKVEADYGVKDARQKLQRLETLIAKWTKIAEAANNDPAAMVEAIQHEVWDKIDMATYGL